MGSIRLRVQNDLARAGWTGRAEERAPRTAGTGKRALVGMGPSAVGFRGVLGLSLGLGWGFAPPKLAAEPVRLNVGTSSLAESDGALELLSSEYGARMVRRLDRIHVSTVRIPRSALATIRQDRRLGRYADFIEEDTSVSIPRTVGEARRVDSGDEPRDERIPNDPDYSKQWGPKCLDLETAWEKVGFGMKPVTLAIIDTGADVDHPDLDAHVDTFRDWDFVNDDDHADDDNGHGTHCAGIAAAETHNGIGGVGVLNGIILPIKVLNAQGYGHGSDVAAAILYAMENGASVISMSLGGTYDSAMKRACDEAWNSGVLVFAAAGNHGTSEANYPSSFTSVIGVGALESCSVVASWSGRGFGNEKREGNVELVAPGFEIYSSFMGGGYRVYSGTSMASPHAAGVGLGYRAVVPDWTAAEIRSHMQSHADPLGDPSLAGYGRVDPTPGSGGGNFCPTMEGRWSLDYEWDGTATITFKADHTFVAGAYSGTWEQVGCDVNWLYTSGTYYWGTMTDEGRRMSGEMESWVGWVGTWDATRDNP